VATLRCRHRLATPITRRRCVPAGTADVHALGNRFAVRAFELVIRG